MGFAVAGFEAGRRAVVLAMLLAACTWPSPPAFKRRARLQSQRHAYVWPLTLGAAQIEPRACEGRLLAASRQVEHLRVHVCAQWGRVGWLVCCTGRFSLVKGRPFGWPARAARDWARGSCKGQQSRRANQPESSQTSADNMTQPLELAAAYRRTIQFSSGALAEWYAN